MHIRIGAAAVAAYLLAISGAVAQAPPPDPQRFPVLARQAAGGLAGPGFAGPSQQPGQSFQQPGQQSPMERALGARIGQEFVQSIQAQASLIAAQDEITALRMQLAAALAEAESLKKAPAAPTAPTLSPDN